MKVKEKELFRIGEIAKRAGVTARTIRYYEELGLIDTPIRKGASHRLYTLKDLNALKRIKQLKNYGLTLSEIKEISDLAATDPTGQKGKAKLIASYIKKRQEALEKKNKLEEYIKELEWHIEQLRNVKNFNACPGTECAECEFVNICEFADINPGN